MLKPKHLLHPVRTANLAARRVAAELSLGRFASHSKNRFKGDSRYDLQNVTDGFSSRVETSSDDTAILQRICEAYRRAITDPRCGSRSYQPTAWWNEVRQSCLRPVMRALEQGDIETLRRMYGGFFRDRCATGLIGLPHGMVQAYFHGPIRDVHRHSYLGDALYRLDYWREQTGGRFGLAELSGPVIGNPFGVTIGGTLVRRGSEYQHYCAHQIIRYLQAGRRVVGEIGGGYGGVAWYLLRDGEPITYVDFDVPESIALASYYLLKAFPSSKVVLYGEEEMTPETLAASDIVLLPVFEMSRMPEKAIDLTFSSHTLGDLSDDVLATYMGLISRMTKERLLYRGKSEASERLSAASNGYLSLEEARSTFWNRHNAPKTREVEHVYCIRSN